MMGVEASLNGGGINYSRGSHLASSTAYYGKPRKRRLVEKCRSSNSYITACHTALEPLTTMENFIS